MKHLWYKATVRKSDVWETCVTEDTFIIRIWCEYSDHDGVQPEYRGTIEHVSSGKRQYLPCFAAIFDFISFYGSQPLVLDLGPPLKVGGGRMWQVRQWMQRHFHGE